MYIFLFGNTWLIAWHVSYLDYMGGPYESGSHCNQCKDLPTFSTVFFCCLHYCITVIYYVLFCLINYFQVQVQVQVHYRSSHEPCHNQWSSHPWSMSSVKVTPLINKVWWRKIHHCRELKVICSGHNVKLSFSIHHCDWAGSLWQGPKQDIRGKLGNIGG